jgi:hypothetical protein
MGAESPAGVESTKRYCWNCGESVADKMNYCPNCRADLSDGGDGYESEPVDQQQPQAERPTSGWYTYIFVGIGVIIIGLVGIYASEVLATGATSLEDIRFARQLQGIATLVAMGGAFLTAFSVFKDATHLAQTSDWSPRRWVWTIGSFMGGINFLVIPAYLYLRKQRTNRS